MLKKQKSKSKKSELARLRLKKDNLSFYKNLFFTKKQSILFKK